MMARQWRKAANKDVEALLQEFADAGWTVTDSAKYYRVKCPCGAHQRWIHLTPSGGNYTRNASKWLYRQPCMRVSGRGEEGDA